MQIAIELLALAEQIAARIKIPAIAFVWLPRERPAQKSKHAEFGLITLADGSSGFFYALLGDTLERARARLDLQAVLTEPVIALARRVCGGDDIDRAIGLAAISAISQHLFRRTGFTPDPSADSIAELRLGAGDHIGMVGLFPPLVARLRARGLRLTVIEKVAALASRDGNVEVTLDPARLRDCNKVLCTAATLLNDTLDEILGYCAGAERIAVIGPTAACLPDPLLARGVDSVGASTVTDGEALRQRLEYSRPWGDAVVKYTLTRRTYPGFATLLDRTRNRADAAINRGG